jgi:hypothetical protein
MKLYSRFGADSVESPEFGTFTADADGGIEVPEALGLFLHNQHIGSERVWENDAERANRLVAEEHARRSDPAYLASIVEELSAKVAAQPVKKAPVKKAADVEAPVVEKAKDSK